MAMTTHRSTYPVDTLLSVFNLLMAGIWLTGVAAWEYAPVLVAVHAAAAALPWLLRRVERPSRPVWVLRRLYPMVWLLAFWTEVDLVRRRLGDGAYDAWVVGLEDAVLGIHLHEVWMPNMHALWFSELMYAAYFGYYLTLVLPILWLLVRRSEEVVMDALFRMMATFTVCFLLYALWPVDGPRHMAAVFDGPNARGVFYRLVDLVAVKNGSSLGAAFPSSHVAGAFTVAWIARRHMPRWAYWILSLEAAGVFLSTFYTQQHYAIDAVAGVMVAVVVQGLAIPIARRGLSRATLGSPAVPPLPQPVFFTAPEEDPR